MDDVDLLQKAARANPGDDVPLLMLADEFRARGDERVATEIEITVALRGVVRRFEALLGLVAGEMVPRSTVVAKAGVTFCERVAADVQAARGQTGQDGE